MRNFSFQFAALCLLTLPVIVGCTADLGKLRAPSHKDAALGDAAGLGAEAADASDLPFSSEATMRDSDAGGADQCADAPAADTATAQPDGAVGAMGGASGAAGSAETSGAGGGAETDGAGGVAGAGGGGSGGASSTGGSGSDGSSPVDDSASSGDAQGDLGHGEDVVADVPVDLSPDSTGDAFFDAAPDVPANSGPDLPAGTLTCPTTILGSIDASDKVQTGRISRVAPFSTCGTSKFYPGKDADPTNSHLYDVLHFLNPTNAPVCFNFTLTYPGPQLYGAAYVAFDPTDIGKGYLGDLGDVLTAPQGMGITVGAGSAIDVVISAVAIGTAPAGSYTLSCSVQ